MDFSLKQYLFAFIITLLAGLSTGLGGLIIYYKEELGKGFLAGSLGFSAGVMLFLSFFEILPEARLSLEIIFGESQGLIITIGAFFVGMGLIALLDRVVPDIETMAVADQMKKVSSSQSSTALLRAGIMTAIAIAIHNFPEGLVSFMAALRDPVLGINLGIAIAIHNIPEGISVAVPIYYATGSKKQAVKLSFLSGMTEPLGAIAGFLLIRPFMTEATFGIMFAIIAGIMTYIALSELLPIAHRYGDHKTVIRGLIAGMVVISLSLIIA